MALLADWYRGDAYVTLRGIECRRRALVLEVTNEVADNTSQGRFELMLDGHTAELFYRLEGDRMVLVHTEVPKALGGRGIGGELVQAAVRRAVRDGLTIVPSCPYARRWLEKHPDQRGDVAVEWAPS